MNFKKNILLLLFLVMASFVFAQNKKLYVHFNDNTGLQFTSNDFIFTTDSLFIRGDSDFGRQKTEYLRRKLLNQEIKKIKSFLKSFPLDSLEDAYFNDYKSMGYISPEHYPRVVIAEINFNGKEYKTKMTNCYAYKIADLISFFNTFIPDEVEIKLKKEDFDAFIK
ncbi:MAG: hypothetical protein ACHQNT_06945 [Bacteroidia bacterium]